MHLFLADVSEADRIGDGGGVDHEGENIEVVEIPLAELFRMAREGRIPDAKTLIIVQRLMLEEVDAG
jgi:ADP-ribose pyrophosphatase